MVFAINKKDQYYNKKENVDMGLTLHRLLSRLYRTRHAGLYISSQISRKS